MGKISSPSERVPLETAKRCLQSASKPNSVVCGETVSLAQELGNVNHNIVRLSAKTNKPDVSIQIGLSIGVVVKF